MQTRLIFLIERTTLPERRFKQLEAMTGIAASSWQKVYIGRQRPTQEMIEAICRQYPSCALWLTTGMTDEKNEQFSIEGWLALKKHPLDSVLKKNPDDWTSDEAAVVRINQSIATRAKLAVPESVSGEAMQKALSHYTKAQENRYGQNTNDMSSVHVWRDADGTHTNIERKINLREPLSAADFEWSYHGTGPRELAANVLIFFGCSDDQARLLATHFSQDVIANLGREQDQITKGEFDQWMKRKGRALLQRNSDDDQAS